MNHSYKFKDVVIQKGGFLRGPFGGDLKKEIFVEKNDTTYKVYEQGVVLNSDKNIGRYYISEEDYKAKLHKFSVQDKDFLVSCSGVNMGAIYQLKTPFERGIINQALLRIRLNEELIDDNYFKYLFKELISKKIISGSGDSTIPNFPGIELIKNIEFELPAKYIQVRVGQLLSDIDSKIALNNRINTELEAMAKTLYDYWFVQFDFPVPSTSSGTGNKPYKSSGGKMVWNDELKREVPEGWEVGTIGDYCPSTGGFAFKSEWWTDKGVSVVKIKDIQEDYTINLNDLARIDLSDKKIDEKFKAKHGDVLIAMTGATVGKYAIVPKTDFPIYVNQRVGFFNLGTEPTKRLPYLINSLNQSYFREAIFTLASGAAQPNISNEQINSIHLIKPKNEIISHYNTHMESSYKKIINNQQENLHLTSLRDWLLPMLMNGQVKVGSGHEGEVERLMAADQVSGYGENSIVGNQSSE